MPLPPRHRALALAAALAALSLALPACGSGEESGGGPPPGPKVGEPERPARPNDKRPNVIVIVTDDQRTDTVTEQLMPNTLRLLRDRGSELTNFVISSPLCCPSRAIQLTGQYGHNNGILANHPGYPELVRRDQILPAWLGEAGYRTAHLGRYLNGYRTFGERPGEPDPAWEVWYTLVNNHYYDYSLSVQGKRVEVGDDPEVYATDVLNDATVEVIEQFSESAAPFYVQLDHIAPHSSLRVRGRCKNGALGGPEDKGRFKDVPLPQWESLDEADTSDKPPFIGGLPRLDETASERVAERYRCRIESLPAVDRGVAEIFAALKRTGELENTVVIFYSDNGFFLGEHRIEKSKALPYEEALRVPFLIRIPPKLREGPRVARVDRLAASIDIVPTILELAKAKPCVGGRCRTLDGRSLLPLLGAGDDSSYPAKRDVLVELSQRGRVAGATLACEFYGLRTADQIAIEYTSIPDASRERCEPTRDFEAYDLATDPAQLDNLVTRGGRLDPRLRKLLRRARELRDCAGIRGRDERTGDRPFCD